MQMLSGRGPDRRSEPANKPYIEAQLPHDLSTPAIHWADIAADCGYYDQPHFIKEFRQFAGTTPTDFMRRMSDIG
jgi:AraC-like DNA-binding protein